MAQPTYTWNNKIDSVEQGFPTHCKHECNISQQLNNFINNGEKIIDKMCPSRP